MTHALENYNRTISIGGRQITNLRFADDIDGITGEEDELTKRVHNLDTAATQFGFQSCANNGSTCQTKNHLERQEHQNKTQNKTNARPGHNNIPLCM